VDVQVSAVDGALPVKAARFSCGHVCCLAIVWYSPLSLSVSFNV
jgi:hypothetical protein